MLFSVSPCLCGELFVVSINLKIEKEKNLKNLSIVVSLCLFCLVSSAWAQTDPDGSDNTAWFAQINGNTCFPSGHLSQNVDQGWGFEASLGYRLPGHVEISVESGYDTYLAKITTFNGAWSMTPLVLKGQIYLGSSIIRPYLFVPAGLAFNSESASFLGLTGTANETDLLEEGGFGFALPMGDRSSFFIQGKVEADNTTSHYANDQPTLLFPVSAGVQFMLN